MEPTVSVGGGGCGPGDLGQRDGIVPGIIEAIILNDDSVGARLQQLVVEPFVVNALPVAAASESSSAGRIEVDLRGHGSACSRDHHPLAGRSAELKNVSVGFEIHIAGEGLGGDDEPTVSVGGGGCGPGDLGQRDGIVPGIIQAIILNDDSVGARLQQLVVEAVC